MKLHMADILLHRARLFRDRAALEAAAKLIEETGYHRRDEGARRRARGVGKAGGVSAEARSRPARPSGPIADPQPYGCGVRTRKSEDVPKQSPRTPDALSACAPQNARCTPYGN